MSERQTAIILNNVFTYTETLVALSMKRTRPELLTDAKTLNYAGTSRLNKRDLSIMLVDAYLAEEDEKARDEFQPEQREILNTIKRSGQNILRGCSESAIESLVLRGLIFRLQGGGVGCWAFTAKGREMMNSPELDWMSYHHAQALRIRKDMINAREVRVMNPTREGDGVMHNWTRILTNREGVKKRYSFTMVVMPTGELRYEVSRLDGEVLPNGGTFSCDWTRVRSITFAPGSPMAPKLVQRPGKLGHMYKTLANGNTRCVSRDHRYVADANACAFDAMWDITVKRNEALSKLDTIDQRQMVDVMTQVVDNGREDLIWILDSIDADEFQKPNGNHSMIPCVGDCAKCHHDASRCDECVLAFLVDQFKIMGPVSLTARYSTEFDCYA